MTATTPAATPAQLPSRLRTALLRYRIMAYVTGVLLLVLTVGVIIKYTTTTGDGLVTVVGIAHGWLFIVYLLATADLGIRARFPWGRILLIGIAGTVPAMSFVAERSVVRWFSHGGR